MDARRLAMIAIAEIGEKADELTLTPRLGKPSIAEEILTWLETEPARALREALRAWLEEVDP